jgi:GntR family transcriptional repressor for pyruvate dehydrogenase complex
VTDPSSAPRKLSLIPEDSRLPKASEILAGRLRSQILAERLEPGDLLPSEAELIETTQFSRGTVREALRLLEADGLIVIKRGLKGGVMVRYPDRAALGKAFAIHFATSRASLRDFFTLRLAIEPLAASEAAANATDDERQLLAPFADHPSSTLDIGEAPRFHDAIAKMTHNSVLEILLTALSEVLDMHMSAETYDPEDVSEVDSAHAAIAAAVISGDRETAEKAMLDHVVTARSRLERLNRLDDFVVPDSSWR